MGRENALLVQPEAGAAPLVAAIAGAQECVELCVFKLTHPDVTSALRAAVARGVAVRALVAHANGERHETLRKLELDLLELGATVSRSDDDLVRYHGKMMIVDRARLYVLGFNFTRKDIERSRSMAVVTTRPDLVGEATALFDADFDRRVYVPGNPSFVVSPYNSRTSLTGLLDGACHRLLIYDRRLNDKQLQRVIRHRAMAGVDVRVIGAADRPLPSVEIRRDHRVRLHVRAIVSDEERIFVGSQSLRRVAMDSRREVGVIIEDRELARQITASFERDWIADGPESATEAPNVA